MLRAFARRFRSDLPCQANDFKTDAWRHILKHGDAEEADPRGSGAAAVHSRDLYVEVAEAKSVHAGFFATVVAFLLTRAWQFAACFSRRDFHTSIEGSMSFSRGDLIRIVSKNVFVGEKRYWSGR